MDVFTALTTASSQPSQSAGAKTGLADGFLGSKSATPEFALGNAKNQNTTDAAGKLTTDNKREFKHVLKTASHKAESPSDAPSDAEPASTNNAKEDTESAKGTSVQESRDSSVSTDKPVEDTQVVDQSQTDVFQQIALCTSAIVAPLPQTISLAAELNQATTAQTSADAISSVAGVSVSTTALSSALGLQTPQQGEASTITPATRIETDPTTELGASVEQDGAAGQVTDVIPTTQVDENNDAVLLPNNQVALTTGQETGGNSEVSLLSSPESAAAAPSPTAAAAVLDPNIGEQDTENTPQSISDEQLLNNPSSSALLGDTVLATSAVDSTGRPVSTTSSTEDTDIGTEGPQEAPVSATSVRLSQDTGDLEERGDSGAGDADNSTEPVMPDDPTGLNGYKAAAQQTDLAAQGQTDTAIRGSQVQIQSQPLTASASSADINSRETLTTQQSAVSGNSRLSPTHALDQVVRAAQLTVQRGVTDLTIRLDPPDLGILHVKVSLSGGELQAQVRAESATTHQMILTRQDDLREALRQSGLRLDQLNVPDFNASFSQFNQQRGAFQWQQQTQFGTASFPGNAEEVSLTNDLLAGDQRSQALMDSFA